MPLWDLMLSVGEKSEIRAPWTGNAYLQMKTVGIQKLDTQIPETSEIWTIGA